MKLEAAHLKDNKYAVRPAGALGTCGWIEGQPWDIMYVHANSPEDAVEKAITRLGIQPNPKTAELVSEAAELHAEYGDHQLGDL